MQNFKTFYSVTGWLLFLSQVLSLVIMVYNKIKLGRVLYYGNPDEPNPGFERYFQLLEILLYSSFALIIIWGFLTPFAVMANRRLQKGKINIFIGVLGFIMAIILFVADPFGMFKWFTG